MKELIIAIDGTAGSGKSTTAKLVAQRLNYLHIDTGAMYRAAAYAVIKNNVDPDDMEKVEQLIDGLKIRLRQNNGTEVLVDGRQVTDVIRRSNVTAIVSKISSYQGVRTKLIIEQREMGKEGGVVLEGRDIGTVVYPDADIKIFFVADIEERARRRHRELSEKGESIDFHTVLSDIKSRDYFDSTRKISPLKKAGDAVTIDTSNMTIDQQVENVLSIVSEKRKEQSAVRE